MAPPSMMSTTKALMPQESATSTYSAAWAMDSLLRYRAFTSPGMGWPSKLAFSRGK